MEDAKKKGGGGKRWRGEGRDGKKRMCGGREEWRKGGVKEGRGGGVEKEMEGMEETDVHRKGGKRGREGVGGVVEGR